MKYMEKGLELIQEMLEQSREFVILHAEVTYDPTVFTPKEGKTYSFWRVNTTQGEIIGMEFQSSYEDFASLRRGDKVVVLAERISENVYDAKSGQEVRTPQFGNATLLDVEVGEAHVVNPKLAAADRKPVPKTTPASRGGGRIGEEERPPATEGGETTDQSAGSAFTEE